MPSGHAEAFKFDSLIFEFVIRLERWYLREWIRLERWNLRDGPGFTPFPFGRYGTNPTRTRSNAYIMLPVCHKISLQVRAAQKAYTNSSEMKRWKSPSVGHASHNRWKSPAHNKVRS